MAAALQGSIEKGRDAREIGRYAFCFYSNKKLKACTRRVGLRIMHDSGSKD